MFHPTATPQHRRERISPSDDRRNSEPKPEEGKIAKQSQLPIKPKSCIRFEPAAGGTHVQVVAEGGVHAGDLIRVKVVRDLEGAFAEGIDDRGWISGVREADALQQLAGVPPVFGVRVTEHAPGVRQG